MYEKKINILNQFDRELSHESFKYNVLFASLIIVIIFMLLFIKKTYYYQNIIIDKIEERDDVYLFSIHFDIGVSIKSNIYKILLYEESLFKYVTRIIGG